MWISKTFSVAVDDNFLPVRTTFPPPDPEEESTPEEKLGKPWFMKDGKVYPTPNKGPPRLFPDQADGDRIVDQLMYIPEDYQGKTAP